MTKDDQTICFKSHRNFIVWKWKLSLVSYWFLISTIVSVGQILPLQLGGWMWIQDQMWVAGYYLCLPYLNFFSIQPVSHIQEDRKARTLSLLDEDTLALSLLLFPLWIDPGYVMNLSRCSHMYVEICGFQKIYPRVYIDSLIYSRYKQAKTVMLKKPLKF